MTVIKRIRKDGFFFCLLGVAVFSLLLPKVALTKSPTIYIAHPDNGSIVSGTETIIAGATDNTGVTQVKFFLDGAELENGVVTEIDGKWSYWSYAWDTSTVSEGPHTIEAEATDTSGKTAIARAEVIVKNSTGNVPPVSDIYYSWDGYKYYFYPYDCYDPDGYIMKYEYTISRQNNAGSYDEIEYYSCCSKSCNPCDGQPPIPPCLDADCDFPDEASNFCLFFSCPYVCYEFPEPENGTDIYKVQLKVWDNDGAESDMTSPSSQEIIAIDSLGSTDAMYVWSMNPKIKHTGSGATLTIAVQVKHDSNSNGQSENDDSNVSGIIVEMKLNKDEDNLPDGEFGQIDARFDRPIFSGTTDRDGKVIFSARGLAPGDYRVEVTDLTDPDGHYEWNSDLDLINPRDVTIWQ
jgi:hypothetical protein